MADSDIAAARELLRDSFTRLIEHADDLADELTDEVAYYRPTPDANTVAWLLWHSARVQDAQLCDIAGIEEVWTRDGWADRFALDLPKDSSGYGHTPDQVAKVRASAEMLAGYYHAVHAMTLEFVASVTAEELERVVDERWTPPRHGERAHRQHHRRLRAAPGTGGVHPGSRRLSVSPRTAVRWWPPIALVAMALLGLVVGRGSTPLDDWFARTGTDQAGLGRLLFFTEPLLLEILLVLAVLAALWRRRWRLAAVGASTPVVAVLAVRLLKPLFGREREGTLAYPSGHVTVTVAVVGVVILVAGARAWTFIAAAVFVLLAVAGQAFTYHYFTDTLGAVLLGSALVCLAVLAAGLDRCQPGCDLHHSGG